MQSKFSDIYCLFEFIHISQMQFFYNSILEIYFKFSKCWIFYRIHMFQSQVSQIEADLKTKAQAYNALKTSLQTMEKKQTGSLMTRHLVIYIWVLIFCFCAMLLNYMNNALLLGEIIEIVLLYFPALLELVKWGSRFACYSHDSLCDFSFQLEMGVLREQVRYSKMSA